MKKKAIERVSEQRMNRINELEFILGRRREEIMALKGELQGMREVNGMLEAFIYQMTEEKGCVEISREKLSEGVRKSFSIEVTEDKFILRSEE